MKLPVGFLAICTLATVTLGSSRSAPGQAPPVLQRKPTEVLKVTPASLNVLNWQPTRRHHPLTPLLETAGRMRADIHRNVDDYTCVLVKRERILGNLMPYEYLIVKFRGHRSIKHSAESVGTEPRFSVYMKVLAPKSTRGREVLYVDGENDGEVLVSKGGRRNGSMTFSIRTNGRMVRRDNRYPITEFGIENLLTRVMEVAEEDMNYDECEVRTIPNTTVDGRTCTLFEVKHPIERPHFRFHLARVFVDDQLQVPVRFAAFGWPESDGGEPILEEEYTFRRFEFNVGLTDADFDRDNAQYNFEPSRDP